MISTASRHNPDGTIDLFSNAREIEIRPETYRGRIIINRKVGKVRRAFLFVLKP